MPANNKRLNASKLYLILDAQVLDHTKLLFVLKDAVRFGIDIVQLRDKFGSANDILSFTKHALKLTRHQIPFIVNDRVDLALLSGADGVHLGQDDIAYKDARKMMGHKAIIGVSCQDQAHVARAIRQGVDYIGFGSVFKTLTKPERNPMHLKVLRNVLLEERIPIFPIGGINRGNVKQLVELGARRVAVCRDILLANDLKKSICEFKGSLDV